MWSPRLLYSQLSGVELYEIISANVKSITNFDVKVSHWANMVPESPEDEKLFPELDRFTDFRLTMDHDNDRCLFVQRQRDERPHDSTQPKNRKGDYIKWNFSLFDKGSSVVRYTDSNSRADRPKKVLFEDFCLANSIPHPQAFGYLSFPVKSTGPLNVILSKCERAREDSTVKQLPDGSAILHDELIFNGATSRTSMAFDAKTWLPTQQTTRKELSGKSSIYGQSQCFFERIDGIYCPISISYSKETIRSVLNSKRRDVFITCNEVGTVELEWVQLNKKTLEFPDVNKLGHDIKAWLEFVGINSAGKDASR